MGHPVADHLPVRVWPRIPPVPAPRLIPSKRRGRAAARGREATCLFRSLGNGSHTVLDHIETTTSRGAFTTASGVVHTAKSVDAVDRHLRATCSRCDELAPARGETCRLRRRRQHPPLSSSRVQRNPFPTERCSKIGSQPPQPRGIGRLLSRVSRIAPPAGLWIDGGGSPGQSFEVRADASKAGSCTEQRGAKLHAS